MRLQENTGSDDSVTIETLVSKEQMAADSDGKLHEFLEYAERIVAQFVTIVVEQDTAAEQAEEFNKNVSAWHMHR